MISDHVRFLKDIIESLSFSDGQRFRGRVYEVYPAFGEIESLTPCACIRHAQPSVTRDESSGHRIKGSTHNIVRKSRMKRRYNYAVDFWLNADGIESDYLGDDESVILKMDDALLAVDTFRDRHDNPIEIETHAPSIVDDQNDTTGLYKAVFTIAFIETAYATEKVAKFPETTPVDLALGMED